MSAFLFSHREVNWGLQGARDLVTAVSASRAIAISSTQEHEMGSHFAALAIEPKERTSQPGKSAVQASSLQRRSLPLQRKLAAPPVTNRPGLSGGIPTLTSSSTLPPVSSATRLPLQRKLAIGAVNDPLESEADAMAAFVMGAPGGLAPASRTGTPTLRRKCACESSGGPCEKCKEEKESALSRKSAGGITPTEAPPAVHEVLRSPGEPLDAATRAFMEPGFGQDFRDVRIHRGAAAADSAFAVNATAYTVGSHIVFGDGQYRPQAFAGALLLAHELAHTIQQSSGHGKALRRQAASAAIDCNAAPEPEPPRPGGQANPVSDLTLTPGELRSDVLGSPVPLPGHLTLTGNVVNPASGPRFEVTMSPRLLVGGLLQNIDLQTSTRSGTPPDTKPDEENQSKISLINPVLTLDPRTRRLRGRAVLSIGGDYPARLKEPTEVIVEIDSTELGQFSGQLGYGPLTADFTLRLHYDVGRLERSLSGSFNPEGGFEGFWNDFQNILTATVPGINLSSASAGIQSALHSLLAGKIDSGEFAERTLSLIAKSIPAGANLNCLKKSIARFASELTHPGFTLGGELHFFGHRISSFRASAASTQSLAHPLLGAPSSLALSQSAAGVILAPPGAISSTTVPAFGYTSSSFGEKSGTSLTVAALPTLSPTAISAHESPLKEFPVVAYAEVSHVSRVSKHLELGVRATVSLSSALLGGSSSAAQSPSDRRISEWKEAQHGRLIPGYDPADLLAPSAPAPSDPRERVRDLRDPTAADKLPPGIEGASAPLVGISIYGRWN